MAQKSSLVLKCIRYFGVILLALLCMVPFVWMISASLKTNNEVFSTNFTWLPIVPQWKNFSDIWRMVPLTTFFMNTTKLTVIITLIQLFTSSFAAYGFAKIDFKGRDTLFLAYVSTIAIPWQVYMVPQYIMMVRLHLANTHMALILTSAFIPFGVFLLRQFYISIPNELSEAARIDGLGEFGIYSRIILPLTKPALATLTIFSFVTVWNDYMGPLIYINSTNLKTIQLGIKMFITQFGADYQLVMAASLCSLVPVIVIFLSMQRFFVQGVATSGLKG